MAASLATEPTERSMTQYRAPLALAVLALAPASLIFLAYSLPGEDAGFQLLAAALWLVVGLLWAGALRAARRRDGEAGLVGGRAWILVPAILVIACIVTVAGLPLRARFEMSRSAFEGLLAEPPGLNATVPAGLYEVTEFESTDFGYRFVVADQDSVVFGFAYSPNGPPPGPDIENVHGSDEFGYRHLDGPWYTWKYIRT